MAEVIELRIHGVGGGTVEDILGVAAPPAPGDRGDSTAGFYQHPDTTGSPARTVQAYVWGGFSGRNWTRALWLLLLPFALINVAGWMTLPANPRSVQAIERVFVRIVAFGHTMLIVAWLGAVAAAFTDGATDGTSVVLAMLLPAAFVLVVAIATHRSATYEDYGIDGAANEAQREQAREDLKGPGNPTFWQSEPFITAQRWRHYAVAAATIGLLVARWLWVTQNDATGRILTIVAVVVIAVEVGMSALRSTWIEGKVGTVVAAALLAAAGGGAWGSTGVTPPGWAADTGAAPIFAEAPLAILLILLGLLFVMALVGMVGWVGRRGMARTAVPGVRLWTWRALWLVVVGVGVWLLISAADGRWWAENRNIRIVGVLLLGGALGVMWYLRSRRARWLPAVLLVLTPAVSLALYQTSGGGESGNSALLWAGPALLIGLVFVPAFTATGRSDQFRWLPAATVSGLSLIPLAVTYSGATLLVANLAGNAAAIPAGSRWILGVFTGVALLTVVSIVLSLVWRRLDVWRPQTIRREYPEGPCSVSAANAAARWRSVSDGMRAIDVPLTAVTWGVFLVLTAALTRVGRPGRTFASLERIWDAATTAPFPQSWSWLTTLAGYVGLVAPFVAMIILVLSAFFPSIRSKVGIVWDVGTFWPRRFHPLAPPAYSERAVPEIASWVRQHLEKGNRVLIAGHSQGAVLTAAALAQLTADDTKHGRCLAALTHGAPLGVYYRRFWPGTWGGGEFRRIRATLRSQAGDEERWWNAYRLTDPIAQEVFTGPDEDPTRLSPDLVLSDPPVSTAEPCPGARVHSWYLRDARVRGKMDDLGAALHDAICPPI